MKWSKFLFNCKRDSRINQKFEFFQNFQMTSKMFLDIVRVITTSKLGILRTFQGGGLFQPPLMSNRNKCLQVSSSVVKRCSYLKFTPAPLSSPPSTPPSCKLSLKDSFDFATFNVFSLSYQCTTFSQSHIIFFIVSQFTIYPSTKGDSGNMLVFGH